MSTTTKLKVLGICGSLRQESRNMGMLRHAQAHAPAGMEITIADLGKVPLFVRNEDKSPEVLTLLKQFEEAEGVLTVQCDSPAWATQLRLLARQLVARLNHELGHGTVRLIKVPGPDAPKRGYGRLRAPGSRGPGDTWG